MKVVLAVAKVLIALYLTVCVGVHVYGAVHPFSAEPLWSHLVHTFSYALCLLAFLYQVPFRMGIYLLGMLYPFFYHAQCLWVQYSVHQVFSGICFSVVTILPVAGLMVWFIYRPKASNI